MAGLDLTGLAAAIPDSIKAASVAASIGAVTGSSPSVVNRGNYYEIILTDDQQDRLAAWVLSQLNREPGTVRVALSGVATKVVFREYWPQMAALIGAGILVGYLAKRWG